MKKLQSAAWQYLNDGFSNKNDIRVILFIMYPNLFSSLVRGLFLHFHVKNYSAPPHLITKVQNFIYISFFIPLTNKIETYLVLTSDKNNKCYNPLGIKYTIE